MLKTPIILLISMIALQMTTTVQQPIADSYICDSNKLYWNEWEELQNAYSNSLWVTKKIAVSPDGVILAVATSKSLDLYDVQTLTYKITLEGKDTGWANSSRSSLSWSTDSRYLTVARYYPRSTDTPDPRSGVQVWDIKGGEVLRLLPTEPSSIAWSSDNRFIAVANFWGDLSLWETENWQIVNRYNPYDMDGVGVIVDQMAWSPTEPLLAAIDESIGPLFLWYVEHEAKPGIFPTEVAGYLTWSPDGTQLAIASTGSGLIQIWNIVEEKVVNTLPFTGGNTHDLQWSPDGKYLARVGNRGLLLWDMTDLDSEPIRFEEKMPPFISIAWMPDSKSLFSVDFQGTIYRWDIETGCMLGRLENEAT